MDRGEASVTTIFYCLLILEETRVGVWHYRRKICVYCVHYASAVAH